MKITQSYFNQYLNTNYIFEKNPKIAIAVSGGPDSMCLLFLLQKWINKKKGTMIAIIVDHRLRNNSNYEANYIADYLSFKKIISKVIKVNIKKVNKKTMKESRDNRFNKLVNFCKKNNILHLFTGHHYDDNLETFLIRKVAGSNFEGLRCMQNKVTFDSLQVLRPLLEINKEEIYSYNKYNKIKFVLDPSNKNLNYTRTIIRNFLSDEYFFKKMIKKDFQIIKENYDSYKKMIFFTLNELIININNKSVLIDTRKFFIKDILIQSKIIEIISKYLKSKKTHLRYKKIINFLNKLENYNEYQTNLAGIIIKKDKSWMKFTI